MTLFIQNNATGAGAGGLDPSQAAVDLAIIANGDTGLGLAPQVGNQQQVTYAQTVAGNPPNRLNALVNTVFQPNYGAGPQTVNIIILPVLANFTLNDGTSILNVGGTALPPSNSGLAGAGLNNTNNCLVIYDTTQNNGSGYCTARAGTNGTLDLPTPNPIILFHELSHAFRIVNNTLLATTAACNPSSPEENAAIVDENALRSQIAVANGVAAVLRDPGIHCGAVCTGGTPSCCIIASVASGSPLSEEVSALRSMRDGLLRKSEVGFAFFETLHHDYYGFSPQVSTLMARHPSLQQLVLEGFVRPLIEILQLIKRFALNSEDPATLGELFATGHTDKALCASRLALLQRGQQVLNGDPVELAEIEQELFRLLSPALASEHLRWALLEPIRLYQRTLQDHLRGYNADELGKRLYDAICSWSIQMPLDDVWASLAVSELEDELLMLDQLFFHTAEGRAGFRERLREAFGDIKAIQNVLGSKITRFGE